MSIRNAYKEAIATHGHSVDDAQLRVVKLFAELEDAIAGADSWSYRLRRMLPGSEASAGACGIYLWGGVGGGKTFLMDLFYSSLNIRKKKRIHFHRMMHDIHARLKKLENGNIVWVGDSVTREEPPSDSAWQRLEDWFFGLFI